MVAALKSTEQSSKEKVQTRTEHFNEEKNEIELLFTNHNFFCNNLNRRISNLEEKCAKLKKYYNKIDSSSINDNKLSDKTVKEYVEKAEFEIDNYLDYGFFKKITSGKLLIANATNLTLSKKYLDYELERNDEDYKKATNKTHEQYTLDIQSLEQDYNTKVDCIKNDCKKRVCELDSVIQNENKRYQDELSQEETKFNEQIKSLNTEYNKLFNDLEQDFQMAVQDIVTQINEYNNSIHSTSSIPTIASYSLDSCNVAFKDVTIPICIDIYGDKSLVIKSDDDYTATCKIITSLLINSIPGEIKVHFIDLHKSGLPFNKFIKLGKIRPDLFGKRVITTKKDVSDSFDDIIKHIDDLSQFILNPSEGISTLSDYNKQADEKIPSEFIVMCVSPSDFKYDDDIEKLRKIISNGNRCGIHVIFDFIDDKRNESWGPIDELLKDSAIFISAPDGVNCNIKYKNKVIDAKLDVNNLNESIDSYSEMIQSTISKRNAIINDILPPDTEWGNYSTANGIHIPFGINGKNIVEITLGSGTAHHVLLGGATGSGKSSLLHTIITSACTRYSPEELEIYLLDFKHGVEFSKYHELKSKNIRVITAACVPEFAMSVFNKMIKEINNRSLLFRKANVDDISAYRKLGKKMPRILMIADEFQEIFNVDKNDKIGYKCGSLFETIVRQGRSFGVHCIMATQSISSVRNSSLSREAKDQMPERILLGYPIQDAEAQFMLGNRCDDISMIDRDIGTGIITYKAGFEDSIKFDVAYADHQSIESIFKKLAAIDKDYPYKGILYDLDSQLYIEDAKRWIDDESNHGSFLLGRTFDIDSEFFGFSTLYKKNGNNVFIVCKEEHENRLLESMMSSYLKEDNNIALFCNFEKAPVSNRESIKICSGTESIDAIFQMAQIMDERIKSNEIHGHICIIVKDVTSLPAKSSEDRSSKYNGTAKKIFEIMNKGPLVGITVILLSNSIKEYSGLDREIKALITHKIITGMNKSDNITTLMGDCPPGDMDENSYLYCRDESSIIKGALLYVSGEDSNGL